CVTENHSTPSHDAVVASGPPVVQQQVVIVQEKPSWWKRIFCFSGSASVNFISHGGGYYPPYVQRNSVYTQKANIAHTMSLYGLGDHYGHSGYGSYGGYGGLTGEPWNSGVRPFQPPYDPNRHRYVY